MLSPAPMQNRRGCSFSLSAAANGRRGDDAERVALEECLLVCVQQDRGVIGDTANLVGGEKGVLRGGAGCRFMALVFRGACGTISCGAERRADRYEQQSEDRYKREGTCSRRAFSNWKNLAHVLPIKVRRCIRGVNLHI